jgi:HEAT repeat protein
LVVLVALVVLLAAIAVAASLYLRARRPIATKNAAPFSQEFAGLSAAQRVDFIFALAAVDEPSVLPLLEGALADPDEAVALAAARTLAQVGETARLDRFFAEHRGERARRIAESLELLA